MDREGSAPMWIEGPEIGSREARAALALKLVAAAYIVGILLAQVRGSIPVSTLLTVAFNFAAGVIAIICLIVARGIDQRRPWAWAVHRPMLVLLGIASAYAATAALLDGTIRIPYELVLAAWAWLGPPDMAGPQEPERRAGSKRRWGSSARGPALLLVAIVMAVQMAFGHLVYGWGGVLDVHPADLVPALDVACGPEGEGLPPAVTISATWRWTRGAPLPNEIDTIVIGWSGDDAAGRPLYAIDSIPRPEAGIRPGYGELTRPMIDAVIAESRAVYRWAVDLSVSRYAPSTVGLGLVLTPRERQPTTGRLVVKATYVHLDQWRVDAPTVTCTW